MNMLTEPSGGGARAIQTDEEGRDPRQDGARERDDRRVRTPDNERVRKARGGDNAGMSRPQPEISTVSGTDTPEKMAKATDDYSAQAESEWNELLDSDQPITAESIDSKPALANFIKTDLGYDDSASFLGDVLASTPEELSADDANPASGLGEESKVWASEILGDAFESTPISLQDPGSLEEVESIPDDKAYVSLETENGSVTFTGIDSGKSAKDFAKLYSASPTFKDSFDAHTKEHGNYNFRGINPPAVQPFVRGFAIGENTTYVVPKVVLEGRDPQARADLKTTLDEGVHGMHLIAHEFGHSILHGSGEGHDHDHDHDHDHSQSALSADYNGRGGHGRAHTLYMGAIHNELDQAGLGTSVDGGVDTLDYSDDALVFRDTRTLAGDKKDYNDIRKNHGADYAQVKTLLNENPPNVKAAAKLLESLDKEVNITSSQPSSVTDLDAPGIDTVRKVNLKDLILQELTLESTRSNVYGESDQPVSREQVGALFSNLVESGEGDRVTAAADTVLVPEDEVPGLG